MGSNKMDKKELFLKAIKEIHEEEIPNSCLINKGIKKALNLEHSSLHICNYCLLQRPQRCVDRAKFLRSYKDLKLFLIKTFPNLIFEDDK